MESENADAVSVKEQPALPAKAAKGKEVVRALDAGVNDITNGMADCIIAADVKPNARPSHFALPGTKSDELRSKKDVVDIMQFTLPGHEQEDSVLVKFLSKRNDASLVLLEHIAMSGHFPMTNLMQTCQKLFTLGVSFPVST